MSAPDSEPVDVVTEHVETLLAAWIGDPARLRAVAGDVIEAATAALRDRAARWAHELADAQFLLDTVPRTGRYPEAEPGTPLESQIGDALAEERERGQRETADAVTGDLLARVMRDVLGGFVGDGHGQRMRERLAAELGWAS